MRSPLFYRLGLDLFLLGSFLDALFRRLFHGLLRGFFLGNRAMLLLRFFCSLFANYFFDSFFRCLFYVLFKRFLRFFYSFFLLFLHTIFGLKGGGPLRRVIGYF